MSEPKRTEPTLVLGIRYKERRHNPPPGLEWRSVKEGETLASIAAEYGVRPIDLALYNWHTANRDEINWYLYHFVGCRGYEGKWYKFSGINRSGKNWHRGYILVPDYPALIKKGASRTIDATRNGKATFNNQLQVYVVEWLASGETREVSGKWLYVFSGQSGVYFGYIPPSQPQKTDASPGGQPGSAFTLDFPGVFHLKEKPDKLEYEILITSEQAPSTEILVAAAGKSDNTKPRYEYGNKWYALSDPTILQKATSESRENRTSHALRGQKPITIDIAPNGQHKRFYFLLSPVQLGPEAIKFAMNNPNGLVPLLRSDVDPTTWDPIDPNQNVGPTPVDVKNNPITLRVIDPYSWAENISEEIYEDDLKVYIEWMQSKQNETIKELHEETGWATLDHLYVAQILKSVRKSHPKPLFIDHQLKDAALWEKNLEKWEERLYKRNAELNANVHRSLLQLMEWIDGPAHKIIETAILKDTNNNSPQDAIDTGWGILHWAAVSQYMFALEPGVKFLREKLNRSGSVLYDVVLKHFQDVDKDTFAPQLSPTQLKGFRYGYQGVLSLLALKDFVSPPPPVPTNGTRQDYLMNLSDYARKKRDNLIKFFNGSQILPVKLQPPAPLPSLPSGGLNWTVVSTTINTSLDAVDKFTTWVIDPDIKIPRKNWFLNQMANLEQWYKKHETFAKISNQGSSYTLKVAAVVIGGYNLYTAITTQRYDYQKNQWTVSGVDAANAIAGITLAVQDFLSELAVFIKHNGMQRIFPQVMVTSGGPSWGVGALRAASIAGWTFAGINVVAMFVSGITTVISMSKNRSAALSRGDYTAANYYTVGIVGGVVMTAGALAFGYALFTAGTAASATGIGATVGVVLFLVGGIIAAIGTIFGSSNSSDDYQVFARKCFLGKQSNLEPRFGDDPPDWSHAAKSGKDTWSIEKQKRAIINLLGQFKLKTVPYQFDRHSNLFKGLITYKLTPGLFKAGSTVEVALHYGEKGSQTAFTFEWTPDDTKSSERRVKAAKGGIFDVEASLPLIRHNDRKVKEIEILVRGVNYERKNGELLTTVTVRYPDNNSNVIRTRKLVIGHDVETQHTVYGQIKKEKIKADDNEETSGIFE